MYLHDPASNDNSHALALLTAASVSPDKAYNDDPEIREAFDQSLRALAEDIIKYHPGLAHLLIGMSSTPCPIVHGQN